MRTLGRIGIDRTLQGDVDVEELRRVMGRDLFTGATTRGEGSSAAVEPVPEAAEEVSTDWEDPGAAEVLLLSRDPEVHDTVTEAMKAAGLSLWIEPDLATAAVWSESHRPRLLIVDLHGEEAYAQARLRAAWEDFRVQADPPPVVVIVPADDPDLERRVVSIYGIPDYLRHPSTSEELRVVAGQAIRRAEVMATATD